MLTDSIVAEDKSIFKFIVKSNETQANLLEQLLSELIQRKKDITNIFDRAGFSTLHFAIFKNKTIAAIKLI